MVNDKLHISQAGANELKRKEACKLKAYLCSNGTWTFGWGNTYTIDKYGRRTPVTQGQTLKDVAAADQLFLDVIGEFEDQVKKAITVPLTQHQFDVLVSFAYNTGYVGRGLAAAINGGKINSIPSKFIEWIGVGKYTKNNFKNAEDKINYQNNKSSLFPEEGLYNRRDLELRKFMGWNPKNLLLG